MDVSDGSSGTSQHEQNSLQGSDLSLATYFEHEGYLYKATDTDLTKYNGDDLARYGPRPYNSLIKTFPGWEDAEKLKPKILSPRTTVASAKGSALESSEFEKTVVSSATTAELSHQSQSAKSIGTAARDANECDEDIHDDGTRETDELGWIPDEDAVYSLSTPVTSDIPMIPERLEHNFKAADDSSYDQIIERWKELANHGDFESDLEIIDPKAYYSRFESIQSNVIRNSMWYQQNGNLGSSQFTPRQCLDIVHECVKIALYLQKMEFCQKAFNILLEDSEHEVATVVEIPIELVTRIEIDMEKAVTRLESSTPPYKLEFWDSVFESCKALLTALRLDLFNFKITLISSANLCRFVALLFDLALVSYAGSHAVRFDKEFLGICTPRIIFYESYLPNALGFSCSTRNLTCLDEFLGGRPVWVFRIFSGNSLMSELFKGMDSSLSLLAHIKDISDLWGPVWAVPSSDKFPGLIEKYELPKGFIRPVKGHRSYKTQNAAICHWYKEDDSSIHSRSPESLGYDDLLGENDLLLIGSPMQDHEECEYELQAFVQNYPNKIGFLDTRPVSYRSDSRSISVGFTKYLGVTLAFNQKRDPGFTLKDVIAKWWNNGVERRNPWFLDLFIGVEISHCTGNARRIQLKNLLLSKSIFPNLQCQDPDWLTKNWGKAFLGALKGSMLEFTSIWNSYKNNRQDMASLINSILEPLRNTGLRGKSFIAALLHDSKETSVEISVKNNSWAACLKDSHLKVAYGFINDNCFSHGFRNLHLSTCIAKETHSEKMDDCKSFTVLQTHLSVGPNISWKWVKLKPDGPCLQKLDPKIDDECFFTECSPFVVKNFAEGEEVMDIHNYREWQAAAHVRATNKSYGGMDTPRNAHHGVGQHNLNPLGFHATALQHQNNVVLTDQLSAPISQEELDEEMSCERPESLRREIRRGKQPIKYSPGLSSQYMDEISYRQIPEYPILEGRFSNNYNTSIYQHLGNGTSRRKPKESN